MATRTIMGHNNERRTSVSIDLGMWEFYMGLCWGQLKNAVEGDRKAAEAEARRHVQRWIGEGCNSEQCRHRMLTTLIQAGPIVFKHCDRMKGIADD